MNQKEQKEDEDEQDKPNQNLNSDLIVFHLDSKVFALNLRVNQSLDSLPFCRFYSNGERTDSKTIWVFFQLYLD